MRSSIRFIGSSKDRSSRKSEKSKPSSSLTGTKTASIGNVSPSQRRPVELDRAGHARRLTRVEEPAPRLAGGRQRAADQRLEEPLPEDVLGRALEQQLGGLGPLGDRTLAVGEDEVAVDDLPQQRVERVGDLGQDLVGRVDGSSAGSSAWLIGRSEPARLMGSRP